MSGFSRSKRRPASVFRSRHACSRGDQRSERLDEGEDLREIVGILEQGAE